MVHRAIFVRFSPNKRQPAFSLCVIKITYFPALTRRWNRSPPPLYRSATVS